MMRMLIQSGRRRVTHSRAEVMERFQDVGVTSEQARNQYAKQENNESQNENESDHCVSFASGDDANSIGRAHAIRGTSLRSPPPSADAADEIKVEP
jgi:hypothetical protein